MKSRYLLVLLMASIPYSAICQQQTGTIIVFRFTTDEFIIAADSKVIAKFPTHEAVVSQDVCKIFTFDNKYIFAAGGYLGRGNYWDIYDEMKILYRSGTIASISDFASKWAKKMQSILTEDAKVSSPPLGNGGVVLTALFAGIERGKIQTQAVQFEMSNGKYQTPYMAPILPDGRYNAIGEITVFSELEAHQTQRARVWQKRIAALEPEKRVVAIAKLVRDYDLGGKVGGHIDSARITPFKGAEWMSVKPSCQK